MDPVTVAVAGAAVSESVKWMFSWVQGLLGRRGDGTELTEQAVEEELRSLGGGDIVASVDSSGTFSAAGAVEALRTSAADLAPHLQAPASSSELAAAVHDLIAVRDRLTAVTGRRATFTWEGDERVASVVGRATAESVKGTVIGVDLHGTTASDVEGTARASTVEADGNVIGVRISPDN